MNTVRAASAFLLFLCVICPADSTVVFNEIMYSPPPDRAALEWVEFYSQMAVDMDISGWSVKGPIEYTFPKGTIVEGGGFLILAKLPGEVEKTAPGTEVCGPYARELPDSGGVTMELRNNNDRIMDAITYRAAGRWPAGACGSGASLSKRNPDSASAIPENWTASTEAGGTPGKPNFPSCMEPGKMFEGIVSYWNFDDSVIGEGTYSEDFDESDGSPSNWLVHQGDVSIQSKRLRLSGDQGTEPFAWAGVSGSPVFFSNIHSIEFEVEFKGRPGDTVGRHGGIVMCCSEPSQRWSQSMSGYMIDWIDRSSDHGYRISKMVEGEHTGLGRASTPSEPGTEWGINFHSNYFTLVVDGEQLGTYHDATFRSGYIGLWCYSNAGQEVFFDKVTIEYTGGAEDSVGVNHGQVGTSVTPKEGLVGSGALFFDNTENSFVNLGDRPESGFTVTEGLTIEAVIVSEYSGEAMDQDAIFLKADGNRRIFLGFQNDGEQENRDIPLEPPSQPVLSFGINTGGEYSELDMPLEGGGGRPSLSELKDGNAHHICATYDSSTGDKVIYVDGIPAFSTNLGTGNAIRSGGNAEAVIGNGVSGDAPFTGTIDEAAFWERALTPEEVKWHAANSKAGEDYFTVNGSERPARLKVAFNETQAWTGKNSWVELYNYGNVPLELDGFVLSSSEDTGREYVFPATSLASGSFLVLSEPDLGFPFKAEERLFLYRPNREELLCAVYVPPGCKARFPDGTGEWFSPVEPTPGGENSVSLQNGIVISEIMYHPKNNSNERGEYVEIYNRGDTPVNLGGYRFVRGVEFSFPDGAFIGPKEYMVIGKDPAWLFEEYGIENVIGEFDRRLSNKGEWIELLDDAGNTVDKVIYHDSGWWPVYADGGGSSLELRDVRADSLRPGAWMASDSGSGSSWHTYTYRGVARSNRGPTRWNEFVLGLLDEGEVLLDDISVVESPDGQRVEFLQNGTFENGESAWRIIGNHRLSHVIEDPENPGNKVLHLITTGPTEHMHNHAETTFANRERVVNGREYEISFRAKWLAGSNLLNTRLYFNRVPRTTELKLPGSRGTPGRANSAFEENIGPTYAELLHTPVIPESGEEVEVSVLAEDPDGVKGCTLRWSVNDGPWRQAAMNETKGGKFSAVVPGHGRADIVQFYIEAEDRRGAVSTFPPEGAGSRALYTVQDGRAQLGRLHNLRIIMTPSDREFLHRLTNVMSNENLGATVVYDEQEVFYDVGVRIRGSERGRVPTSRVGFNITFNPHHLFRGVHKTVGIDRSGGLGFGRSFGQDEILVKHIVNHAGGIPGMYDDIVYVIAPRNAHTSTALLLMGRYNDIYLESQYQNGDEGMLYTYELIYYPTTTVDGDPESLKLPQPDKVIGVDLQDLGDDKEAYRWFFITENNRDHDDYSRLIEMCKMFSAPTAELERKAPELMDVDEWMRTFAMYSLCGIGDTYMQGLEHNNIHYVRPRDNRVLVFPWDMDFAFVGGTTASLYGSGNLARVIRRPPYTRMFFRHLKDIIQTTFNSAYMSRWVQHYGDLCNQNFTSITSYISQRGNYVLRRLPSDIPFEVTKAGVKDVEDGKVSVEEETTAVQGRAPIEVAELAINGEPVSVQWKSITRWSVEVPLADGPNELEFTALDPDGGVIGSVPVTITSTANWHPPRIFFVRPEEGPETGGTEVQLLGENFQEGMTVRFNGTKAQGFEYSASQLVTCVSPPGQGQVEIEVENPDGLKGKAPVPFTYIPVKTEFMRGEVNIDGEIDIADAIAVLNQVFGDEDLICLDAADTNDDGAIDISDAVSLLTYIFGSGKALPPPFQGCGPDPTGDTLGCESFPICN